MLYFRGGAHGTYVWSDTSSEHVVQQALFTLLGSLEESGARVTHDRLRAGANAQLYGGWPMILSGLKTWLESGEMLTTPGAIEYLKPEARI